MHGLFSKGSNPFGWNSRASRITTAGREVLSWPTQHLVDRYGLLPHAACPWKALAAPDTKESRKLTAIGVKWKNPSINNEIILWPYFLPKPKSPLWCFGHFKGFVGWDGTLAKREFQFAPCLIPTGKPSYRNPSVSMVFITSSSLRYFQSVWEESGFTDCSS